MNVTNWCIAVVVLGFSTAFGQIAPPPGPGAAPKSPAPSGPPGLSGGLAEIFADHKNYSANLTVEIAPQPGAEPMMIPGKIYFREGKSRFEHDLTQATGIPFPADAKEQMRTMGMAETVIISNPDEKISYLIYPRLKSYVEMPIPEEELAELEQEYELEKREVGKETVDEHETTKMEVRVIPREGNPLEATVWYAEDLQNFPVKIETTQENQMLTMRFREVDLGEPDAKLFDPPTDFKKYDDMMRMMQEMMMKRLQEGAPGFP